MAIVQNTWDQVHEAAQRAAEVIDGRFEEFDYEKVVELQQSLDLPEGITLMLDGGYYDYNEGDYVDPAVIASGWLDQEEDGVFTNVIQSRILVS